jgi:hypothetical protein
VLGGKQDLQGKRGNAGNLKVEIKTCAKHENPGEKSDLNCISDNPESLEREMDAAFLAMANRD